MKILSAVMFALLGVGLLLPRTASADSDGYFCSVPGMLAYEVSMNVHPAGVQRPAREGLDSHRLYLVFYSDAGIEDVLWVDLPAFQVHGMLCRTDTVILRGWDAIHIIALDQRRSPRLLAPIPFPTRDPIAEFTDGNLGAYSEAARSGLLTPARIELPAPPGSVTTFAVVLRRVPAESAPCELTLEALIEQTTRKGAVLSARHLLTATKGLECGE